VIVDVMGKVTIVMMVIKGKERPLIFAVGSFLD